MSRIAKYPIPIPQAVTVWMSDLEIVFTGELGCLRYPIPEGLSVEFLGHELRVVVQRQTGKTRSLAGTMRANLGNQVRGVSKGFTCSLLLQGVGYRAQLQGQLLMLNVGFSQPKYYKIPPGLTITVPTLTEILIAGIDIQQVNHAAAEIIKIRPPEPYQGAGIRKKDQKIKLKAAKKK